MNSKYAKEIGGVDASSPRNKARMAYLKTYLRYLSNKPFWYAGTEAQE